MWKGEERRHEDLARSLSFVAEAAFNREFLHWGRFQYSVSRPASQSPCHIVPQQPGGQGSLWRGGRETIEQSLTEPTFQASNISRGCPTQNCHVQKNSTTAIHFCQVNPLLHSSVSRLDSLPYLPYREIWNST